MTSLAQERDEQRRWKLRPRHHGATGFDRLLENEFLAPERHRAAQSALLRELLGYARARVPYYRRVLEGMGKPEETPDQFHRLPLLTKLDLQEYGRELEAPEIPAAVGKRLSFRSSGTTGVPTRVVRTEADFRFMALLKQRQCRWYRLDPMGSFAEIRKPSELPRTAKGKFIEHGETGRAPVWSYVGEFFETGPLLGFSITNPISDQADWLVREKPDYLLSWSNNIDHLAFEFHNHPIPEGLKAIVGIAEGATPAMRRRIERTFGVPFHQNYGLNEIGIVASRCPESGRYHVHPEFCLVEVVDPEGAPCAPGAVGRLVVTGLRNLAMPLLRYDTGDLAEAVEGPCPCGRTLPSFAAVVGRVRHFAYCPPGTFNKVETVDDAIDAMPAVLLAKLRQYQLHQFRDGSFELRITVNAPMPPEFGARVMAAWAETAGAGPDATPLRLIEMAKLPRAPSGKFQKFTTDFTPPEEDIRR